MMDIITGRAPPPARAESHLSKGSRELARHVETNRRRLDFGTRRPVLQNNTGWPWELGS